MSEHPSDNDTKQRRGICGLCYHSPGCAALISYDEQGRLHSLAPDPDAPMGQSLCAIAAAAKEIVYSEHRIQQPQRRVGRKGTFEFEPISWDEAYETIVERLNGIKAESGPEAVGFYAGTGSYERSFKDVFQLAGSEIYLASSVLFPFGSPNTFGVGAPCYTSLGVIAPKLTLGALHIEMFSDIDNSDLILIWGTDPATSSPPSMDRVMTALEEDAEVVVIDPRRTGCARLPGAEWIPIRPGTDGALALGLCHVLIREGLYDKQFIGDWTLGFEDFATYVERFTPQEVSRITSIPAERIERLARSIFHAEGAAYLMYTGLEYTRSGVQSIRAVQVLWAIAGQLDVVGGRCFLMRENGMGVPSHSHLESPGLEQAIGRGSFPIYEHYTKEPHASLLPKAILEGDPYKIRALLVQGASLITSWPDPWRWRRALAELDFLVTIDLQLTADAAFADLVLPATTAFETESYCHYYCTARIRDKIIEPVGQSRPDYYILAELAERLGYGHLIPQTPTAVLENFLRDTRFNLDEWRDAELGVLRNCSRVLEYKKWEKGLLRADGRPGFETPSGKLEIRSALLQEHGYDGLPVWEESYETPQSQPELAQQFPLVLVTGAMKPDMKSCLRAIPSFEERYPHPIVEINREDADERGIAAGNKVVIKSARGEVIMRALPSDNIMRGVVYAVVGGGGPHGSAEWREANVNALTDGEQFDPISGFPVYKTLLCQIAKKRRNRRGAANQSASLGCNG